MYILSVIVDWSTCAVLGLRMCVCVHACVCVNIHACVCI